MESYFLLAIDVAGVTEFYCNDPGRTPLTYNGNVYQFMAFSVSEPRETSDPTNQDAATVLIGNTKEWVEKIRGNNYLDGERCAITTVLDSTYKTNRLFIDDVNFKGAIIKFTLDLKMDAVQGNILSLKFDRRIAPETPFRGSFR